MFSALILTVRQLGDPAILWVLAKSLAVTVFIFLGLGAAMIAGARWASTAYGWGADGGLAAATVATLAGLATAWLFFRAVAVPVIGFFADEVVVAIERRHYPEAALAARPTSFALSMRLALMSLARLVAANILALPLYVLLLFTAVGPVILFVGINALLLGRDLGEMVAVRHLDGAQRSTWLGATRGQRAVLGLGVTGLFLIPVVNFLAPVLGAGLATHLFHRSRTS